MSRIGPLWGGAHCGWYHGCIIHLSLIRLSDDIGCLSYHTIFSVFVGELTADGINGEKGRISFSGQQPHPPTSCMNASSPASPDGYTTATPTIIFIFLRLFKSLQQTNKSPSKHQDSKNFFLWCLPFIFPSLSLTIVIIAAICPRFNQLSIFVNYLSSFIFHTMWTGKGKRWR